MWRLAIALCAVAACTFDRSSALVDPELIDASFSGGPAPDASDIITELDAAPPGTPDATPVELDAAPSPLSLCLLACTGPGASCTVDGTCNYSCNDAVSCGNINCPAGRPCNVRCERTDDNSPCGNIVCAPNQPCHVECIDASGEDRRACNNVSCNGSCACEVECTGSDEACNSTNCTQDCSTDDGCDAQGSCNTCRL